MSSGTWNEKKYGIEHPAGTPEYYRAWRSKSGYLERQKQVWRSKREMVLSHYGGRCKCCGEDRYEFLSVDHIDGGGNQHRKATKLGIVGWLIKHGMPEGFRVLCHNCNMAFGFYGTCPHAFAHVPIGAC